MKEHKQSLNNLPEGKFARVAEVLADGSMRRRLLDLGLIEGTRVECVRKSPYGDPIAYFIRGATIALRTEDSAKIMVHAIN